MSHFARVWKIKIQAGVLYIPVLLHCLALFLRIFIPFACARNWTLHLLNHQRKSETWHSYCTRYRPAASVYTRHISVKTRTSEILQDLSVAEISPPVYWQSYGLVLWRIGAQLHQVEQCILNRIQTDSGHGTLFLGIKQPGCEALHLSLLSRLWMRGSCVHYLVLVYRVMLNSVKG